MNGADFVTLLLGAGFVVTVGVMLYTVRGDGGADGKGGSDESGVGVGGGGLIYSTVSIFGAIFLCLNLILLSVLFVFNEPVYINLMLEDSLFENSTAFLLFLTALLLLAIAMGRSGPGRWLYILGTLAFVFGAGEEISWGQRIFGFETPHYLRDMNTHNEINLHNIKGLDGRLTGIHGAAPRILGVVTAAAYSTRKSSFFGIPFPSVLTMYCFLVANAYTPDFHVGEYALFLLLLFVAYAYFSKERRLFILSVLFLPIIVLEQSIVHTGTIRSHVGEGAEYLFSIACVVYAGELFFHYLTELRGSV